MSTNHNLLGFTRQTETILCGVGAQNLIKECEKRNISTDALCKLTKEDFVQLGAEKDQAENIFNALCISKVKKRQKKSDVKPYHSVSEKVEILRSGERQFRIIQDYVKYCRMKLKKERINFFVDPDKALSASQILCMTADAAFKEINDAELKLKELKAPNKNRKHVYILYSIPFSGLCIATCILLNRLWR